MKKGIVYFIFLMNIFVPVWSKTVLLTSLDPELNRPPLRSKNWNINEKLEEIFKEKIDNKDIEIIHFADQANLYATLHDPEVSALFWVSHSSNTKDSVESAISTASVMDYRFRDVLPLFQDIPPNIKYLALVGCRSELIINELKKRNLFKANQSTKLFLEDKKVDARKSLKRALKEFNELKKPSEVPVCREFQAIEVRYKRVADKNLDSIRIVISKNVVAVLPAVVAGETQEGSFFVTHQIQSNNDLKIMVDSGASSRAKVELGTIEFSSDVEGSWKLFAKPDGTPFGVGSHVYQFKFGSASRDLPYQTIEMCN
ncbi:MAG: hypothetical protein Fur0010_25130 [Bdellovibrio sp.]